MEMGQMMGGGMGEGKMGEGGNKEPEQHQH
jgi:hypothetical protein